MTHSTFVRPIDCQSGTEKACLAALVIGGARPMAIDGYLRRKGYGLRLVNTTIKHLGADRPTREAAQSRPTRDLDFADVGSIPAAPTNQHRGLPSQGWFGRKLGTLSFHPVLVSGRELDSTGKEQ